MFIRTEKSIKDFIHFYPVVSTLVIINIVLFLLTDVIPLPTIEAVQQCTITNPSTLAKQLYDGCMVCTPLVTHDDYWRLVTAVFLLGGLPHVPFNSFALVLFAPPLGQMLGKIKFVTLYFIAGIIGNVGTYLVAPAML